MTPDELLTLRSSDWQLLTALAQRAKSRQLRALSESELAQLGQLYRAATSDLAIAQRDFPGHDLARYLNQLVGSAHNLVYRGEGLVLQRLKAFYLRDFPRLFRQMNGFMWVSALLTFGPALVYFALTWADPEMASYVLPARLISHARDGTQWWKDLNEANQVGAAGIMTNNLRVSFLAFAGGVPFGLLTVYILFANGLSFGGVFGTLLAYGHAGPLGEFVIGHGVLELNEIVMSGASGLMMGYALLRPGLHSRKNALVQATQQAVKLLLGSAPLLVVAGLIEGFISPSDTIPAAIKIAIGVGSGVLLYAYLALAGRQPDEKQYQIDLR